VRNETLSRNIFQLNTRNSQVRTYREVSSRLQQLEDAELELLLNSHEQDQRYLLWLAVCRCYPFIAEFAVEVLSEKFLSMDMKLDHHDYDLFFNKKMEWHDELGALSHSTRSKLRQVLFRILREANLLSKDHSILPAHLSPEVSKVAVNTSSFPLIVYPASNAKLGGLLT